MEHGFDTSAGGYDDRFTSSLTGSAQRERVHAYLDRSLPAGRPLRILELACGTGEDAVWFARKGHTVTATDASEAMLQIARRKSDAANVSSMIEFRRIPIEEIRPASTDAPYDVVFSNFGGLNCVPPSGLRAAAPHLRALVRPGGRLIIVLMTSACAWETAYYLLKGRPREALRRRSSSAVAVRLGGAEVPTYYYSPASAAALFRPAFRLVAQRPVGFFLPPSYLEPYFAAHPRLFRTLFACERAVAGSAALAPVSDHALLDFEAA